MWFTAKELMEMPDPEGGLFHGRRWGGWMLDAKRHVLVLIKDGYEIDLETIDSSAEMLDWIFQVRRWTTPEEMADLLKAFRDIFHPQANLCSCGADLRIENPTDFLQRRIKK